MLVGTDLSRTSSIPTANEDVINRFLQDIRTSLLNSIYDPTSVFSLKIYLERDHRGRSVFPHVLAKALYVCCAKCCSS